MNIANLIANQKNEYCKTELIIIYQTRAHENLSFSNMIKQNALAEWPKLSLEIECV